METMKKWKYLEVTLRGGNNKERHVLQVRTKAIGALKQMWNIGKKKFGDYKTRMMLFNSIVRSIMLHGKGV